MLQCLIENNKVHNNAGDGIDFSRNMYNSIARNNIIYNEPKGILVSQSHNNRYTTTQFQLVEMELMLDLGQQETKYMIIQ